MEGVARYARGSGCGVQVYVFYMCSLIRPEILEELVKMICEEPPEDAEEKVKFK